MNNPGFVFHDSPGFETGDKTQLLEVQSFIEEKSRSKEVDDQLHAIWSVRNISYILTTLMVSSEVKGFALF